MKNVGVKVSFMGIILADLQLHTRLAYVAMLSPAP